MRKTSVRKFIHMVIDILPLLIIPIFALNILHKETEPISIEVQEKISVDFNQKFNIDTITEETIEGITYTKINDNSLEFNGTCTGTYRVYMCQGIIGHKYVLKGCNQYVSIYDGGAPLLTTDSISTCNTTSAWYFRIQTGVTCNQVICTFQIYDLTQMGLDNITLQEFNDMFSNAFYPYTESKKMLVDKTTPTTYDNTDIGSQFVYALYKPVHDYFNFNDLFNMGAIYNWIELHLFSGTAPLPIFIIWNVIVYEFFVDLIFLLYGVFMFIIDFAEKCLERPFRR